MYLEDWLLSAKERFDNFPSFFHGFNTKKIQTLPYSPRSNLSERFVKTVKDCLAIFCNNQSDWSDHLNAIVHALNNTPCIYSSGYAPAYIFLGRVSNLSEGLDYNLENASLDIHNFVQMRHQRLIEAYKIVKENLEVARERYKKNFDRRVQHQNLVPGDVVYVFSGISKQAQRVKGLSRCLNKNRWLGPYIISDIFGASCKLVDMKTNKLLPKCVNIRRLKRGYLLSSDKQAIDSVDHDRLVNQASNAAADRTATSSASNQQADSEPNGTLPAGYYVIKKILSSF